MDYFPGRADMARHKRWYDADAGLSVHVIPQDERNAPINMSRWRHPRVEPTLGECLIYPVTDGPGLGLLVLLPPILWFLSLPIFDLIAMMHPLKSHWALGLLIVPVLLPMFFSFAMTFGYAILFLGHVLVSSALGDIDHPRWPEWHPADISEGLCRWFWAALFGVMLGGIPIAYYWLHCGQIDWFDWFVFGELIMFGAGYAQMALAASLLHENIIAANPITVFSSIFRLGVAYLRPCLVASITLVLSGLGVWGLFYKLPHMWMEAVALWVYWILTLYGAMVTLRMMGLTYHAHALDLSWFRRRPRWASSRHQGQIYVNS
jgi:hypothetical protein